MWYIWYICAPNIFYSIHLFIYLSDPFTASPSQIMQFPTHPNPVYLKTQNKQQLGRKKLNYLSLHSSSLKCVTKLPLFFSLFLLFLKVQLLLPRSDYVLPRVFFIRHCLHRAHVILQFRIRIIAHNKRYITRLPLGESHSERRCNSTDMRATFRE